MIVTSTLLSQLSTIWHGFGTRQGGVSTGLYSSLNCTSNYGDSHTLVDENRRRLIQAVTSTHIPLYVANQVHGSTVLTVNATTPTMEHIDADGLVTNQPGVLLGILTADCVPVLLVDPEAKIIGACHSGWRGAWEGIIANTVAAMEDLGANSACIRAVIGPCIGRDSYEVDTKFYETFVTKDTNLNAYFTATTAPGKFLFDLPAFVSFRLKNAGVTQIEITPHDTYTNPDMFFSYRYATHHQPTPTTGRQLSVIGLRA